MTTIWSWVGQVPGLENTVCKIAHPAFCRWGFGELVSDGYSPVRGSRALGGAGDDWLVGGHGVFQVLEGGNGADQLDGGGGDFQRLYGGQGADSLFAGSGYLPFGQALLRRRRFHHR